MNTLKETRQGWCERGGTFGQSERKADDLFANPPVCLYRGGSFKAITGSKYTQLRFRL